MFTISLLLGLIFVIRTSRPNAGESQWTFRNRHPLRFTSDGTFQIAILQDLHYGEAEDQDWGPQQDFKSEEVINTILDVEFPQLVVLNGDLITGENTFAANSSLYVDEIVRPLLQRGLTWASTYGNHDCGFNLSNEALFEREHRFSNSRTERMVPLLEAGITNYHLPVYSSDINVEEPVLLLWFFDSRGGSHYQERDAAGNDIPYHSFVNEIVVKWFLDTSKYLSRYWLRDIPSLAFVHIPINAMAVFQQAGVDIRQEPGINNDNPLSQQAVIDGTYTGEDIPFMSALLDTAGMTALFSGHDHGNDWCFKWNSKLPEMNLKGNGLDVCFGRHTGYGGYGKWMRGSRQILFREETLGKETETWIRLEDGAISGRVMLNSTYGIDEYTPVDDRNSQ